MTYLLDTNILLSYLNRSTLSTYINKQYQPLSSENKVCISVVTVGELKSISIQSNWGERRKKELVELLDIFTVVDINIAPLLELYAEIDAYSQNKLKHHPLNISARNMGKNDLWIAATAPYMEATLITTDKDFDHLHGQYLEVVWLDPSTYK
ncbi:PIN domain-containing protein [Spirosoma migulaei]